MKNIQVMIGIIGAVTICFMLYLTKDFKKHEEVRESQGECRQDTKVIDTNIMTNMYISVSPLSVRNNNPINIVYSKSNDWIGQNRDYIGRFVQFDTPRNGIRASIKVIKANIKATKTVKEFVNRIAVNGDANSIHIRNYIKHLELGLGYKGKIKVYDATKILKLMVVAEGGTVAMSYFNRYYNCGEVNSNEI